VLKFSANPLDAPLATLPGVGPERVLLLARLNLRTVEDLLLHRPRRYEDRRQIRAIADLRLDEAATARGRIVAQGIKRWRRGTRSVFEFILEDGTGRLHGRWWNLPFMEKYFHVGDEVVVYGKPNSLKPRTMDHPETEIVEGGEESFIHVNRIVPIYPLTEGLPQRWLRSLVWRTLEARCAAVPDRWRDLLCGPVTGRGGPGGAAPRPAGGSRGFPEGGVNLHAAKGGGSDVTHPWVPRAQAIRMLHFPERMPDVETARQRLALDEFLELQLEIQRRRKKLQAGARALPCAGDNRWIRPFLRGLGFRLSDAQTRVLREIRRDLGGAQPMRRLLQGDVASGKTVVAACAVLMTLESGFNAVLMAPTEILAEQHFQTFNRWFEPLGIGVGLRTGSRKTTNAESRIANADHRTSNIKQKAGAAASVPGAQPVAHDWLFIGTHALIDGGFEAENLGLVVIDEQHKFGVVQREKLVRKGRYPHLLVMTATPIPRTLGLTLYGDLDVSVIDRPPAGRGRVKTFVRGADRLPQVFEFIRARLGEGRQVYVVYPRVEEADAGGIKAVTREWEKLRNEFAPYRVGLLHGRLKGDQKEEAMAAFRENRVQVLVATSVIEVGVDVPNATVMLIENAEQFGLAQLHQLRGRIGRGAHESWCVLVADLKTEGARQRLQVLEQTADGFQIAEADLRLRGPGELLGREQSGLPPFRFGDLARDGDLVERARRLAGEILERGENT
jgi:ATP-dependent DNA helicase RecG